MESTIKKNVIIDIPFNIDLSPYMLPRNYIHPKLEASFKRAQTREWIERRIELFMKYTCKSLLQQTSQDFICLLRCTAETEALINERLKQYPKLPNNIYFTSNAQKIIDESMKKHGNLYRVNIDSDNMFHKSFIEKLHAFEHKPETLSIVCQNGYILNDTTKKVAQIFHKSPSFYAAIYNSETYKTLYDKRLFEKHWDAIKYPFECMEGNNYCICTHDINVDNEFDTIVRMYSVKLLKGVEKIRFYREWGLSKGSSENLSIGKEDTNTDQNVKRNTTVSVDVPKVSIIIPVYNEVKYLKETILSAINQTYSNLEIMVISAEEDKENKIKPIVNSFGTRIKYYEIPNSSNLSILDLGLKNMQGEYLSWLDQNHKYRVNKIAGQMQCMDTLEDKTTIIYGGYSVINRQGEIIRQTDFKKKWNNKLLNKPLIPVFKGLININTLLVHKSHFERLGQFNTRAYTLQDIELWFKIFRSAKVYYQNEISVDTYKNPDLLMNGEHMILKQAIMGNTDVNHGWIRCMHAITSKEMIQTVGSAKIFYKEISATLKHFPEYREAYKEAVKLASIYNMNVTDKPLVTIIIPFYNRTQIVKECVESILKQTYSDLEILLVDDGSEEDISSLVTFIKQDSRIKLIKKPHKGTAAARNAGIDGATGEYIAFVDSDDLCTPDKIEKQLQFMLKKQVVFSHTSYQRVNMQRELLRNMDSAKFSGIIFPRILSGCPIAASTVMVKRDALGKMRFVEGMTVSQDICLWIDIAYQYELGGLTDYLTLVRVGKETTCLTPEKVNRGFLNVLGHILNNPNYVKETSAIIKKLENFTVVLKNTYL